MMAAAETFTSTDKLVAVEREIAYRRRVYARRVAENRMSQQFADMQIRIFEAIGDDYRERINAEKLL